MKNKQFFLTIILFMLLFTNQCVFASFADYTDEDAEKETQNMIQEHKDNFDNTKSDNSFLKDLTIRGGKLSPIFDKQVVEYNLKIDNNVNEIEITANAEDNKAKVNGTGKINITNVTEHKIEVIAASGTTRTYFIKIAREEDNDVLAKNESENKINEDTIDEDNIVINSNAIKEENSELNTQNNNNYFKKYSIIAIIVAVFIIYILMIKRNSKKSKH